ncbi:MAG: SMC-Scp complex subunit ScpB [Alphaproteobacteria bacterium GM7ARS4]|nr:SMC-Scp complex subunit ScpB [Alphaproteobacteria bacterium GM7ARS4]
MTKQWSSLHILEALLFAHDTPVTEQTLQQWLGADVPVRSLLKTLQEHYKGRGVQLVCINDKEWALRTPADLSASLTMLRTKKRALSKPLLETLAICAYHQPVTRHDIEDIRGCRVAPKTMDSLLKSGWIAPIGRRKSPGQPLLFGTTTAFLDHFSLSSPKDLPGFEELAQLLPARHEEKQSSLPLVAEPHGSTNPQSMESLS